MKVKDCGENPLVEPKKITGSNYAKLGSSSPGPIKSGPQDG